jgi:hypothetical protein
MNTKQDQLKVRDKKDNKTTECKQYASVKSALKGEEDIQDDTSQNYTFIDELLEEAAISSNLHELDQETGYDFWRMEYSIHSSIIFNNILHIRIMNPLFLPEKHCISILDGGADTCVLGKGWEIISTLSYDKTGGQNEKTKKRIFVRKLSVLK